MECSPLLSVIIPTYQRNESLAQCLDYLAPGVQTLSPQQYEVIVTDDGTHTTAEAMVTEHYPWVKWVASGKGNPAANRNHGASYAQGEWLVFTDDDCIPQLNWLQAYAEIIRHLVRDGYNSEAIYQPSSSTPLAFEGAIYPVGNLDQDLVECPVNLNGGCFWSANIAIQRCLFEELGGFDANYPLAAFEDQDLKIRLEKRTKIVFVSQAIVKHPVRVVSLSKSLNRLPKLCLAYAYHMGKHRSNLGYENLLSLIIYQYKFHLQTLLSHLKRRAFSSSLVSLVMLIVGIPLVVVNLRD